MQSKSVLPLFLLALFFAVITRVGPALAAPVDLFTDEPIEIPNFTNDGVATYQAELNREALGALLGTDSARVKLGPTAVLFAKSGYSTSSDGDTTVLRWVGSNGKDSLRLAVVISKSTLSMYAETHQADGSVWSMIGEDFNVEIRKLALPPMDSCGTGDSQSRQSQAGMPQTREAAALSALNSGAPSPVIDILFAWTAGVEQALGGTPASVMAFANVRVLEINEALALNAAGFTVRIAGFYPIPAGEQVPAESSVLLSSIMNRDEVLDPLLDLRDSLGADLVHVFVDNLQRGGTELCGVAYLGRYPPQADLHYLSVSHWWCAAYSTTTLHEIGHNLGAGHNREVGQGPGAFEMAYGYRTLVSGLPYPNVGVADVMSYRMNGYQRLPVFSDPFLTYGGVPMGIAYPTPGYADNATTVYYMGPYVAAFRDAQPTPTPTVTSTPTPSATSIPTSTATPRQPGIDPQIPPTETPTPTVIPTAIPTQPPAPTATSSPTAVPSPTISPVSTIHGGSVVMNIGLGLGVQLKSKKTHWDVEVRVEARDKGTGRLKTMMSSACTVQLFTATSKGAIYKQPVARAFEPFRETGTMSFSVQRLPGIKPEKGKVPDVYFGAKLVCPGAPDIRATTARMRGKQVSKTLALSAWMKRFRRDLAEKR